MNILLLHVMLAFNESLSIIKRCIFYVLLAGISRLSLEPSSGTQQDFTATSKCQKVQSEPERALPVTKYPAFMLGRGRAMPCKSLCYLEPFKGLGAI